MRDSTPSPTPRFVPGPERFAVITRLASALPGKGTRERVCWGDLLAELSTPLECTDAKLLPAWCAATFEGNNTASKCESVAAVVLAYEGTATLDDAAATWADVYGLAYTDTGHTNARPRVRVVLPLSRAVPPSEFRDVWSWVKERATAAGHAPHSNGSKPGLPRRVPGQLPGGEFACVRLAGPVLDVDAVRADARSARSTERTPVLVANDVPRSPAPALEPARIVASLASEDEPANDAPTEPRKTTDAGNALRLVDQHGADLRHVPGLGWYAWDGMRWSRDSTGEAHRRAKATALAIYREAADATDEHQRRELGAHARRSESERALGAMVRLASTEAAVVVPAGALDADAWAFNCTNGTVDLRSGALRPHVRADLITKVAPVAYDAGATCPTWERFLERVLPDVEVRAFLQRFLGYSLTGDVREQVLAFFYGHGANGKTTALNAALDVWGEYAKQTAPELLLSKRGEAHPTEVMQLRGARLAVCSEVEQGRGLAEARLKQLTGGDEVTARGMREDFVTFKATWKLILAANHRPEIRGADHGIWRRILAVPFDVIIPPAERDPELQNRLRAEAPGILRWAVEGCLAWQREGLHPPSAVRAATDAYRGAMDLVGAFVTETCERGGSYRVTATELHAAYLAWCAEAGETALPRPQFAARLEDLGFKPVKGAKGSRHWTGLRVTVGGVGGAEKRLTAHEEMFGGEPDSHATHATPDEDHRPWGAPKVMQ